MNTTQHTPGPWIFAYGSVYRADTLHDESSIRIALMDRNEPHTLPVERDSNARLIAAAPELLAACELAYAELAKMGCECDCENSPVHCPVCATRLAIAKAGAEVSA